MKKIIHSFNKTGAILLLLLGFSSTMWAADETFSSGAYIIDMGQSSQTIAKGLKPYGLVYSLIVDQQVAVRWSINPTKAKDGTDFNVGGKDYKGGTFIIPAEYINANVLAAINLWKGKGVVVDGPIASSFVAPVYKELTSWPRAILDEDNGNIVKKYYENAEIPSASYVLKGDPTLLTGCDDIYVLPHADPQNWPSSYITALDNFIKNEQGYLWAACHAVSALEGAAGLTFLSNTGLTLWTDHDDGSGDYTYTPSYSADPIMQFMGKLDAATTNGSEDIYMPIKTTGSWRSTTKVSVYQPTHVDANPNEASVLIYGPAYGNSNYGMVAYEAGHNHSGNNPANVAAMRAYFNFVLLAGVEKQMDITSNIPETVVTGTTIALNATVNNGNPPYTYLWTSSAGGTFSNPTSANTNFTAPVVSVPTACVINVYITDNCGRLNSVSKIVQITPLVGPTAVDDAASTTLNTPVEINVLTNDIEGSAALNPSSVTLVAGTLPDPTTQGTFTVNTTTGLVTFTPVTGYVGTVTGDYQVCDLNTLCSVATITVVINTVQGPTAVDDNASTVINTPVDINVLSNDLAGAAALNPASVTLVPGTLPNPSTEGTFTVNPTTGLVTFTPVTGFTGTATVDYQVCDMNVICDVAIITVTVSTMTGPTANDNTATALINTPIDIDVLSNDVAGTGALNPASVIFVEGTLPDPTTQGTFSVNPTTGLVTFTPITGFTGTATVDYQVCDINAMCDVATITVNVIQGVINLFPAAGFGTLAFEDLWPSQGDYDFNDLVIDYQFEVFMNTGNFVQQVVGTFVIKAFGASYENGFGFQLASGIDPADLTVSGSQLKENIISLNSNGTESGQTVPTIIVYDNAFKEMQHPGIGIGVNTEPSAPYVTPVTIVINIDFTPDTYTYNDLDIGNFNPFIFVNQVRSVEVHLPDYPPTALADQGLLGTMEDDSNPATGKYYKTANNLPWAINIYESFDYPIEKQDVVLAYLKFAAWATSSGSLFPDWYKDLTGYRNNSLIYVTPTK